MEVWIEWLYKTPKNETVKLSTNSMSAEQALRISDDFEKTGRTKELYFYDSQGTKWSKKELKKLLTELDTEPHDIITYFDGGYDRNVHVAGVGAVIYYTQNKKRFRWRSNAVFQELDSNNEAEYAAFWFMLQQLENLGVRHQSVTIRGDSQVVLKQLSGEWPCFDDTLNDWLDRIEEKMKLLGIHPIYEPIQRKENDEADKLANQAIKGISITSNLELE
jgi:ribonuclease HI